MKRWIIEKEILLAMRLGAFGRWWAASAARRLGKLSGRDGRPRDLRDR